MTDVALKGAYLQSVRGINVADGGGATWSFDPATNSLSVAIASGGIGGFNESVDDRVAVLIQNGTGISWTYNDPAGTLTPAVSLAAFTTTNLSEGANLYFTDERAQDAVFNAIADSSSIDVTYNDAGNSFSMVVLPAGVDHNSLANLTTGDPHTQYAQNASNETIGGSWTFSNATGFVISNANPRFFWDESDQGADERFWGAAVNAKAWGLRTRDDAASAARDILVVSRGAGIAVSSISLGNSTDNPSFTFVGTGATTVGGSCKVVGNSGFNNTAPIAKPTVTGSRGGNAALASLLTALANYGLITDSTTA